MKTIFMFSDTHNMPIPETLCRIAAESDFVLFSGDGARGVLTAAIEFGFDKKLYLVGGNCDGYGLGDELVVSVEDINILLVHGHLYHSPELLSYRAEELGCQAVVYGHTHVAEITKMGNVTLINSGSPCRPRCGSRSYAYAVVRGKELFAKLVNID